MVCLYIKLFIFVELINFSIFYFFKVTQYFNDTMRIQMYMILSREVMYMNKECMHFMGLIIVVK